MKLPRLLHSTRSFGRTNSTFLWKLLVLERGLLSYRLKLSCDRSERDAWFGYSPVGALRKSLFILYSRPAEDWLQRSGSSSTTSPITLFFAISARGQRNCSRSSTRLGLREYGGSRREGVIAQATGVTPLSIPQPPSSGFIARTSRGAVRPLSRMRRIAELGRGSCTDKPTKILIYIAMARSSSGLSLQNYRQNGSPNQCDAAWAMPSSSAALSLAQATKPSGRTSTALSPSRFSASREM
jgi:hypothetical protein